MNKKHLILLVSLLASFSAQSQDFVNLDFESSYVSPNSAVVVPGWNHGEGADTDIYLRRGHLGITQCYILNDSNFALVGKYSMTLSSGWQQNDYNSPFTQAYLAQTAKIPSDAVSVQILARGAFQVLVAGVEIQMSSLGNDLYSGNIEGFAGTVAELKIVNTANAPQTPITVDNISFAPAVASDLVWQNEKGSIARWSIGTSTVYSSKMVTNALGAGWRVTAQADFNGDGSTDFLVQNNVGSLAIQLMRDFNVIGAVSLRSGSPAASGWRAFAAQDMNNDGSADILFQHQDRRLAVWFMKGTTFTRSASLALPARNLRAAAVADFNGDGQNDILLQSTSQKLVVSYGPNFSTTKPLREEALGAGWRAAGVLNNLLGDGSMGVVFQHVDGRVSLWRMNGTNLISASLLQNGRPVAAGWKIVAAK